MCTLQPAHPANPTHIATIICIIGPTGAHSAVFNRKGLKTITAAFKAIHKADGSHLIGLDTMFAHLVADQKMALEKKPCFYQKKHPLQKRR